MNIFRFGMVCISLFLVGCAVSNTYDYRHSSVDLPVQGHSELGLAVIDQRPYILSGDKEPNFVGLQRGGFGNPFQVRTESGGAMVDDMAAAIASELQDNGFKTINLHISTPDAAFVAEAIRDAGATRNIILTVREWKSDAYASLGLSYDLNLKVLDELAKPLAESEISGNSEKLGGAGFESGNSASVANAFSLKITRLFNDPNVQRALNDVQ
jgi:hypothetical protein